MREFGPKMPKPVFSPAIFIGVLDRKTAFSRKKIEDECLKLVLYGWMDQFIKRPFCVAFRRGLRFMALKQVKVKTRLMRIFDA